MRCGICGDEASPVEELVANDAGRVAHLRCFDNLARLPTKRDAAREPDDADVDRRDESSGQEGVDSSGGPA